MEHPRKRRRIESPTYRLDSTELEFVEEDHDLHHEVQQRLEVRDKFKSRLEHIFAKYERDFTGVGDEIDLVTGQVIVDNGHLLRMQDEDDIGDEASESDAMLESDNNDDNDTPLGLDEQHSTPAHNSHHNAQPLQALLRTPLRHRQLTEPPSDESEYLAKAKDPRWRTPDIPEIKFNNKSGAAQRPAGDGHVRKISSAARSKAHESRRRDAKSPGGSLWTYPERRKYTRRSKPGHRHLPGDYALENEIDEQYGSSSDNARCNGPDGYEHVDIDTTSEGISELDCATDRLFPKYINLSSDSSLKNISLYPLDRLRDAANEFHDWKAFERADSSKHGFTLPNTAKKLHRARKQSRNFTTSLQEIPLECMWTAFPAIGTPQVTKRERFSDAAQEPDYTSLGAANSPLWETKLRGIMSAASLVPYGPGQCSSTPSSVKKSANHATPCIVSKDVNTITSKGVKFCDPELPIVDDVILDIFANADTISRATSVTMDLMALGSDSLVLDTNYTPDSLRSVPIMEQAVCIAHGDESKFDPMPFSDEWWIAPEMMALPGLSPAPFHVDALQSMPMVLSIPNTTQDSLFPGFWNAITEPAGTLPGTRGSQDKFDKASQQSSTLSSLSSSDPRIARSSDIPNSENIVVPHVGLLSTVATDLESAKEIQSSSSSESTPASSDPSSKLCQAEDKDRILGQEQTQEDPPLLPNPAELAQNVVSPEDQSLVVRCPPVHTEGPSAPMDDSHAASQPVSPIQCQVIGVKDSNPDPESANNTFAESSITSDATTASNSCALGKDFALVKYPRPNKSVNKAFIPVRPQLPLHAPSVGRHSKSLVLSKPSRSRLSGTDEALCGIARGDLHEDATHRGSIESQDQLGNAEIKTKHHGKSSEKIVSRVEPSKSTVPDSDHIGTVQRNKRETTPIDTYCYILADPWPVEPLAGDRIPDMTAPIGDGTGEQRQKSSRDSQCGKMDMLLTNDSEKGRVSSRAHKAVPKTESNGVTDDVLVDKIPYVATQLRNSIRSTIPPIDTTSHKSLTSAMTSVKAQSIRKVKLQDKSILSEQRTTRPAEQNAITTSGLEDSPLPVIRKKGDSFKSPHERRAKIVREKASVESAMIQRKLSPTMMATDISDTFGHGRPLTRANLLSLDEIPSTSQDTILNYLSSQATPQPTRNHPMQNGPNSTRSSQEKRQSMTPSGVCGVDGFSCGRKYCFNCTSRAATQDEIEF